MEGSVVGMLTKEYRTIDIHNHVWELDGSLDRVRAQSLLESAEFLGIETVCVSLPLMTESPKPHEFVRANDLVLDALEMSTRFLGFCYLNPGYAEESVAEMKRCIEEGPMVGAKLYHQYRICDPAIRPVMEYAAELNVPVLMHAGKVMDAASLSRQPRLSHAGHFLEAISMYPDTTLIQAHIGGGGDWQWNLRMLESLPPDANYLIDTSGSVIDAEIVLRTVETVGIDRVLFATDGSMEEGVGKVLDSGLDAAALQAVFGGNARRVLGERIDAGAADRSGGDGSVTRGDS